MSYGGSVPRKQVHLNGFLISFLIYANHVRTITRRDFPLMYISDVMCNLLQDQGI